MSRRHTFLGALLSFALGLGLILSSSLPSLQGQQKLPPVKIAPQTPTLTTPAYLGIKTGDKAEVVFTGTNLAEPTGIICTCSGVQFTIPTDNKNGTNPNLLRVQVAVPPQTPIGVYGLRLATRQGVSNMRPFVVDELPAIAEVDNNRSKTAAQSLTIPAVVLGRTDAESSDFFKIAVSAGQRLTIEVLARRLGSPLDPWIVLYDAKTQRELIHLTADDTPGLQGDCRLIHTFSQGGEYLIEVRDSTWRGGADFHYRLRIADCPGVTTAFPLALQRGQKGSVGFAGPGAESLPPVVVQAPADRTVEALLVAPRYASGGVQGWPVPVHLHDWPETTEQEPNNSPAQAHPLPLPGGVSARFDKAGDLDHFRVTAKKGQKIAAVARAFEFRSPCEVFVRVLNAKGNELARSNPAQLPARAEWTAPEDGDYVIACEHLNYRGGANEVYHLTVLPVIGDFTLSCPVDRLEAPPGGSTALLVAVNRIDGFKGPIELQAVGSPVVNGSITVPAGQDFTFLPLHIPPGTPPSAYTFRVQGRAAMGDQTVIRHAFFLDQFKSNWGNMSHPPLELAGVCALAVVHPPFSVAAQAQPPVLSKGQTGKLLFSAKREKSADGDIALSPLYLPPNITTSVKAIPKGQTEANAELKVAPNAASGSHPLVFQASSKVGGKDYVLLAPLVLQVTESAKDSKSPPSPSEPVQKK
jgi:hypothetical protein